MRRWKLSLVALAGVSLAQGLWGHTARASEGDDSLTSLSYISYLERYATIAPASQRETLDAVVNMPVLPGDRLETARGARVEVQLADGSTVWLDQLTTVDFDAIARSRGTDSPRTVIYLAFGNLAVEVAASAPSLRVESPAGTVYLTRGGLYRLELVGDQLRVGAFRGAAELPAGMGSVLLRAGFVAWVANGEELQRESWNGDEDDFWRWVLERRLPPTSSNTAQYVAEAPRAYVLDAYGDWVYVADLDSWGWRPRVTITWVPYQYGRWYWTPTGWCWVSYEPWGWYPYHYGSWYFSVSLGWVWFWDPVWSPAWVHWIYTPGYVGWCPRGYYDWWWWRHGGHHGHHPHRWTEVSFDFSGRVRLGYIDHRPWTFVPEDRFTYAHIERVRLKPERVLQTLGPEREAYVRTGPLLAPAPSRGQNGPALREVFVGQDRASRREVTEFLRREPTGANRISETLPPRRTSEFLRPQQPLGGGESSRPPRAGEREARPERFQRDGSLPEPIESSRPSRERLTKAPAAPRPAAPVTRRPSSWEPRREPAPAEEPLPGRPVLRSAPPNSPSGREGRSWFPRSGGGEETLPRPAEPRRWVPRSGSEVPPVPRAGEPRATLPRSPAGDQPRAVAPRPSSGPPQSSSLRSSSSPAPSSPRGAKPSQERPRHHE